ncbi:DoxX family protein [Sediminibacillus massiliensis]|uniref:DoxX family protein n=1 Tax=Sediminibacillus massiliensis TaxID=1926277 RepID=UPI000BAE0F52|nr:DoxX family protein [Sediminibacillus massiliensis]
MKSALSSMQLIRYIVGYVFIVSGLIKLLNPEFSSIFAHLGIPSAATAVIIIAVTEVVCAGLIILNFHVKKASVPLLFIMIAAILLTKVPILHTGFLSFAFEARLDIVILVLLGILWRSHSK